MKLLVLRWVGTQLTSATNPSGVQLSVHQDLIVFSLFFLIRI